MPMCDELKGIGSWMIRFCLWGHNRNLQVLPWHRAWTRSSNSFFLLPLVPPPPPPTPRNPLSAALVFNLMTLAASTEEEAEEVNIYQSYFRWIKNQCRKIKWAYNHHTEREQKEDWKVQIMLGLDEETKEIITVISQRFYRRRKVWMIGMNLRTRKHYSSNTARRHTRKQG